MKRRRIAKAVQEYREKYYKDGIDSGLFYVSDFYEIKDLATAPDGKTDLLNTIRICLEAGFEIGYRTAKRHLKGG